MEIFTLSYFNDPCCQTCLQSSLSIVSWFWFLFLRYMILPNRNDMKWTRFGKAVHRRNQKHIFERVGIMLHGKHSFCTKFACIIKVRSFSSSSLLYQLSLNFPFMCVYYVVNFPLLIYFFNFRVWLFNLLGLIIVFLISLILKK